VNRDPSPSPTQRVITSASPEHDVTAEGEEEAAAGDISASSTAQESSQTEGVPAPAALPQSPHGNTLLDWLCNIDDEADLRFLLKGITTLLDNPQILRWLPGSQKCVNIYQGAG
jgi:hypothetical protein